MNIGDIGSTDDTALLCITNRPPPPSSPNSGGDWFEPKWIRIVDFHTTPGFMRNRDIMVVRLLRHNSGTPVEGLYSCLIADNTRTGQTVYVGLYNHGGTKLESYVNFH